MFDFIFDGKIFCLTSMYEHDILCCKLELRVLCS